MTFARFLIALYLVTQAPVHADTGANFKDLACSPVPHSNKALCYSVSYNDIAPYVDWELYIKSASKLELHSAKTFQLATPGGFLFSPGGLYLAQEFTEEGHPNFTIYRTESFLKNRQVESIYYFEDYHMEEIIAFDDNGELVYRADASQCKQPGIDCIIKINFLNN